MRLKSLRLLFGAFLVWYSGNGLAQHALPAAPVRVVFVCEHGTVKSLVAMSYFNQRAAASGLPFRAIARGTAPEPRVPNPVREGLGAAGFNVSNFVPQRLKSSDVDGALLVVSFDEDISATVTDKARLIRWDRLAGVLADYPRGRDAIVQRVDELLDELARRGGQ